MCKESVRLESSRIPKLERWSKAPIISSRAGYFQETATRGVTDSPLSQEVSSGILGPRMRALLVEDDDVLGRAIQRTLEEWGNSVTWCKTLADALRAASSAPDLVVMDVGLPDGSGVTLAEALSTQRPAPLVVAMSGRASASEAFRLGALGVRGYLPKPVSFAELVATIDSLLERAPDLSPLLVASVGKRRFQDVQEQVRRTMTEQALALANGNRTEAARLLGVTRQAVQQLIRNLEIPDAPKRPQSD